VLPEAAYYLRLRRLARETSTDCRFAPALPDGLGKSTGEVAGDVEDLLTSTFGQGDVNLCDGVLFVSAVTVDDVQKLTKHGWPCLFN
jgi:hypothetical protein